jgi:regulator of CtrA degradation
MDSVEMGIRAAISSPGRLARNGTKEVNPCLSLGDSAKPVPRRPLMSETVTETRLTRKLVDSLYVEAMVLADEARAYFEDHGLPERDALSPALRVGYAVESLKVTTRIMHVIAWLLTWRGEAAGEIDAETARRPDRRLGEAGRTEDAVAAQLPGGAQQLIAASTDLYERVRRLERELIDPPERTRPSPARSLLGRLERAF